MRAKRKIKLDEKQYQENLDRAREADKLSLELIDSYEKTKGLTREDTKKLERLEKLTRKIRSEAGGSDEDTSIDNPPNELKPALSRLSQVTTALRKIVEKTPRQVVSATVIQQANVILQLVRITRSLSVAVALPEGSNQLRTPRRSEGQVLGSAQNRICSLGRVVYPAVLETNYRVLEGGVNHPSQPANWRLLNHPSNLFSFLTLLSGIIGDCLCKA